MKTQKVQSSPQVWEEAGPEETNRVREAILPSKDLSPLKQKIFSMSFEFCVLKHVKCVLRKTFLFSEPL